MSDEIDRPPLLERYNDARNKISKALESWFKFYRTKSAIVKGVSLQDMTAEELQKSGYLGPWKFNAYQTAFAGTVGSAVGKIATLLTGTLPRSDTSEIRADVDPEFDKLLAVTIDWLSPLLIPLILTAFVFCMGWGSLRREDSNRGTRKHARHAYLYFDAAYGFYTQLFFSIFTAMASTGIPDKIKENHEHMYAIFGFLIFLTFVKQVYITWAKIPQRLFATNGYTEKPGDPTSKSAPWFKLLIASWLGSWPIALFILIALYCFAYISALGLHWIKGFLI